MTTIMLDLPDKQWSKPAKLRLLCRNRSKEVPSPNMLAAILPVLHDTPVDMQRN